MARRARPAEVRRQSTHACPGGCGEQVARHLLACRSCWWLLPKDQRDTVIRLARTGPRVARQMAVVDALEWYRTHCADGELLTGRGGDGRG